MNKITIIHSVNNWLAQTETWIYSQIKNTDPSIIESHISCKNTLNIHQFCVKNIHSQESQFFIQRSYKKLYEMLFPSKRASHILKIGKKNKAQIIHSHFGNRGWTDLPAAKELGCKHIITFYGYDVNQLPLQKPIWKKRYKEMFSKADFFLCEGSFMAQSLINLGCDKNKVIIQHLGVDIERIVYKPRVWKQGEVLKILISSGFREKKGIPYALRAIAKISNDFPIEVTIIGDAINMPSSCKEKKVILATINTLNLDKKITLLGFQPHEVVLEEAYNNHIFLSPSITAADGDSEGGAPVSIIEMIATGMIVISTSHCDIPEVVNYPDDNWLVNERDVDALVIRLQWLIDNPEKWGEFQDKGREYIEKEYDTKKQGKKLTDIYLSLLDT